MLLMFPGLVGSCFQDRMNSELTIREKKGKAQSFKMKLALLGEARLEVEVSSFGLRNTYGTGSQPS